MDKYESFFRALEGLDLRIGDAVHEEAGQNVGEFQRQIPGVIRVRERGELDRIISEANRWLVPIYPFSRGCNWGYGSKLPAKHKGVLVDLSALDGILDIDEELGIATIEPGVTQGQLAAELMRRQCGYYLDVTGSGSETSILGNALERGIAYSSIRVQQLAGLEVLLATGESFRTGFGGYENDALAGLYPYGLGPAIDGLFFQSNLGIVLEGKVQLAPRPEGLYALTVSVDNDRLEEFVDRTAQLKKQGELSGIPHLGNRERAISTITPLLMDQENIGAAEARAVAERVIQSDWTLTASVTGASSIAKEKIRRIRAKLAPLGKIYVHAFDQPAWKERLQSWLISKLASRDQQRVLEAAAELRGFHRGEPSDAGIRFLLESGKTVDSGSEGFLLCTPLAPLSGQNAEVFHSIAAEHGRRYSVRVAVTQNIITDRVLEAVISVHFPRTVSEQRDRAHECVHGMTETFEKLGFYPYRVNIDQMAKRPTSDALTSVIQRLKKTLDPNGIIAPGRYD